MDVLQLDVSGRPQAWITPREAALLYACDGVAWTLGGAVQVLRGGIQRSTGLQSRIEVHAILAVRGAVPSRAWRVAPALSNPKLFVRGNIICNREVHSSIPIGTFMGVRQSQRRIQSNNVIPAYSFRPREHPRISIGSGRTLGHPGRASTGGPSIQRQTKAVRS